MAAGMHQSGLGARPFGATGLLNGQGIHVGTQAQAACAGAAFECAYHAGAPQTAVNLVAPRFKLGRHQLSGAMFFKRQLGVAVNVTPELDEFTHSGGERFAQVGHAYCGCKLMDLAMARNCAVPSV